MKLHTHISVEECKSRLVSCVDAEKLGFTLSGYAGSKPILGTISDNGFRLQKRRCYRNSFAPLFFGRFVASDNGTLIEGAFRMHLFVRVFITLWFSGLVFGFVAMLTSSATGKAEARGSWFPFSIMMVFGFALVKFGQWLGQGEEKVIVAFLKSTLEANDVI